MSQTVVSMIHVPDVRATVDWYTSIGFKLVRQNEEDGEINWAKLTFGISEVMFQSGEIEHGAPSRGRLVHHHRERRSVVPTPQGPGSSRGGPL